MKGYYRFLQICLFISFFSAAVLAQDKGDETQGRAKVAILGVFHFAYPNLDRIKTSDKDKINFRDEKRLIEINELVDKLAKFKPTKIAVENKTWEQAKTDSLYNLFLEGKYVLPINESFQVGFQLARKLGLKKINCIDAWGNIDAYFTGDGKNKFNIRPEKDSMMQKMDEFYNSLQKVKSAQKNSSADSSQKPYLTITEIMKQINQPEKVKSDHASYFKNLFLFEEKQDDYAGVDWLTASWFNRNLRIFRNIQRITESPSDRILVIFGSGHLGLLNEYISDSPDHTLVPVLDYLE